ncbi:hypothetical protein J6590_078308 [Homalodisca vitripennis]|nr:hypothetical protein J6590_078308 [Homalodisca vitripennis]
MAVKKEGVGTLISKYLLEKCYINGENIHLHLRCFVRIMEYDSRYCRVDSHRSLTLSFPYCHLQGIRLWYRVTVGGIVVLYRPI